MHFVPSLVKVKERCLERLFNVWETKGSNIVADLGRVLLKVVNPNVDVNVDVDVTFVNFAFY